ncbi:hypothetical protein [Paraglaciecola hydrolytica]|uniref:Hedgehog N-terminal signalling domain-containing protein n=1 Tax=Paraglaciecola hydrolytica TaxID=1799789 RepID=A0A148KKJ6_9ALTE|nr:hypothetical protein [Paraglaciecola hydrolytica]KXI26778.1 hypothetical protein AX660_03140 [Paraglaciecola hydrolytica]
MFKNLAYILLFCLDLKSANADSCKFNINEHRPSISEVEASGISVRSEDGNALEDLFNYCSNDVVIKFEEGDCSDSKVTKNLKKTIFKLVELIDQEWEGERKLRITEAWDNNAEHTKYSLHNEGRAADITTDDRDTKKLSKLACLAMAAGFSWVKLEKDHVHASVPR